MKISVCLLSAAAMTGMLFASDGSSGGGGTKQVSLHIPNEMAPPGGVVQMKFLVTEPTPISSGKPIVNFDGATFDAVWGIELFCATGDVNGVALVRGSQVVLQYTTTAGAQGTDYPIMTMALHIRPDALVGMQTQFALDPSSTWILGLLGATTLKPIAPAIVTVNGSISITNIVPGGGTLPAGTVVSIQGMGFQPKTQVQLNAIKASSIQYVSPQEIRFTLAQDTNMTGQKIQVTNPDGSQDVYFSYLRGVPVGSSARPLLQSAVPVFSQVTQSQAVFAPMAPALASQYTGLAIQNPQLTSAAVSVTLHSQDGSVLGTSTIQMAPGTRIMRETSELAQGIAPPVGSYVVVQASQPVQALGFLADDAAGTVMPLSAVSSKP